MKLKTLLTSVTQVAHSHLISCGDREMGNPPDELKKKKKLPLTVPVLSTLGEILPEAQRRLCFVIVI